MDHSTYTVSYTHLDVYKRQLQPSYEQQDEIFQRFIERYPNLKCIARHVRYAHSGSENSLKAFMWYDGHTFESKLYTCLLYTSRCV